MRFIVNKLAGHGTAAKVWDAMERYLSEAKLSYSADVTQYAGHAVKLAREAAENGEKTIYALGGDGTVRETACGIIGTDAALGIIPAGTGNDIIKALNLPQTPLEAFKKSLTLASRPIDVCTVNGELCVNAVGTGFDVEALMWTARFKKRMKGLLPYLLGVIFSILNHKDVDVKLTVDGKTGSKKALLVAAANGMFFGGGMKIGPNSIIDDGLLDITIIGHCPKWRIPFLLPRFIKGNLEGLSFVETLRCKQLTIERKSQMIQIDGELFSMDRADIQLIPGAINVLG